MNAPLNPAKAFAVYGAVVAFVFCFFVMGLLVARRQLSLAAKEAPALSTERAPVEDLKVGLDFYQTLEERPPDQRSTLDSQDEPVRPVPALQPQEPPPGESPSASEGATAAAAGEEDPPAGERELLTADSSAEADPGAETDPVAETDPAFTIQVGALASEQEARVIQRQLEEKNYTARILPPISPEDRYFRVWVGEFRTPEEAQVFETVLRADGFHTFVRRSRGNPAGR